MSDINVKSSGRAVDGKHASEQRERLDAIKARKAKASSAKAATKKKAASKKAAKPSKKRAADGLNLGEIGEDLLTSVGGIAMTAIADNGEEILDSLTGGKSGGKGGNGRPSLTNILLIVLILAVLAVGAIVLWPRISTYLGLSGQTVAVDLSEGKVMEHKAVEFNNAILQRSRQEQQLVVWEQDIQVDTQVSDEFLGWGVFRKAQTVHSMGTGVYAVDLSKVTEDSIAVDQDKRTVTVHIPRPHLRYITKDLESTVFEDTEHAILGFGDLKLTQEQQNLVERSIEDAMRAELVKKEQYADADEAALLMVYDTYEGVCKEVSSDYELKIEFTKGSKHADDSGDVSKSELKS